MTVGETTGDRARLAELADTTTRIRRAVEGVIEGKREVVKLAITVLLALAGAFVASLTFVPAMVALLIRGEVAEKDVRAVAWVKERYEPVLGRVIARPWPWIGAGAGTFAAAALVFTMLGSEFLPVLGEGNLAMQAPDAGAG